MQTMPERASVKSPRKKFRGQMHVDNAFRNKPQKFSDSSVSNVSWQALFPKEVIIEHNRTGLLEHISGHHSVYLRYGEQLKMALGNASFGEFHKQRNQTKLLKTAVKNLFRKVQFLELTIDLMNEFISEDEYEQELSNSPDKYVIKMKDSVTHIEISAIREVINSLSIELSTDETAEIFGIDIDNLQE